MTTGEAISLAAVFATAFSALTAIYNGRCMLRTSSSRSEVPSTSKDLTNPTTGVAAPVIAWWMLCTGLVFVGFALIGLGLYGQAVVLFRSDLEPLDRPVRIVAITAGALCLLPICRTVILSATRDENGRVDRASLLVIGVAVGLLAATTGVGALYYSLEDVTLIGRAAMTAAVQMSMLAVSLLLILTAVIVASSVGRAVVHGTGSARASLVVFGSLLLYPSIIGAGLWLTPHRAPSESGNTSDAGEALAAFALQFVGADYSFSGDSGAGFDSPGFVMFVVRNVLGSEVTHDLNTQYDRGEPVEVDALQPGDVVFFQNTFRWGMSHNGIYVGDGTFVHAENESTGVTVTPLDSDYYASRYYGAVRYGGTTQWSPSSATGSLATPPVQPPDGISRIRWPFEEGQEWVVGQGYATTPDMGGSHWNCVDGFAEGSQQESHSCREAYQYRYSLDLARADDASAGEVVFSPVTGIIRWVDKSTGGVSISLGDGYAVAIFHISLEPTLVAGGVVFQGQSIGTVAPPGGSGNGGWPHVHLALWQTADGGNWDRKSVPFEGINAIDGTSFPDIGGANQHRGQVINT